MPNNHKWSERPTHKNPQSLWQNRPCGRIAHVAERSFNAASVPNTQHVRSAPHLPRRQAISGNAARNTSVQIPDYRAPAGLWLPMQSLSTLPEA